MAPQSPYSPDLGHCDFFLFEIEKSPQETSFWGTLKHLESCNPPAQTVPVSEFQHYCEDWESRLLRCVDSQESYFEDDNIKLQLYSNKKTPKISLFT